MDQIDKLSSKQRKGILSILLLKKPLDLFDLAQLIESYESVDELLQITFIKTDHKVIWIEQEVRDTISSGFKWSEKVKAADLLAHYFQDRAIPTETKGDLWQMAGKKENACQSYVQAMEQYRKQQLLKATMRVGEKVIKLDTVSPREEVIVLDQLIECYEGCGQVHDVIEARKKLLDKPEIQNDHLRQANIWRALAIDYGKQGSWLYYKKYREKAARTFRELEKYEDAAIEFLALTNRGIDEINLICGLKWANEAVQDADRSEKKELIAKAKSIKAYLMAMSGNSESAHHFAEEALEFALKNNLLDAAAYAYRKLAGTYEYASNYSQAKEVYAKAAFFCEAQNIDTGVQLCFSCLSWVLFRMGEWKKAIEVSRDLIRAHDVNNPSKTTAYCVIAYIEALRGKIRIADKHTHEGILLAQKEQFLLLYHMLQVPMAKIFELRGKKESANEWYEKIVDEWHETKEKHDVLLSLMDATVFFLDYQNQEAIRKCLNIFSKICRETGNDEAMGSMAFGLGIDAILRQQEQIALAHFAEARKYLAPLQIPYQLILVDFQIGKCLLSQNKVDKAKDLLGDLQLQTKKLGLAPLHSKITSMLNGISLERLPGKTILTTRQFDVLKLLYKGMPNKEIASELYLSTRTVDMHIRNLFDRLGCNTRWDAVEKAKALRLI